MPSKAKKTARKRSPGNPRRKPGRSAALVNDTLDAVVNSLAIFARPQIVSECLIEAMLANDMANMTREFADNIAASIAAMQGHPLGTDEETKRLVCEILARAIERANNSRPAEANSSRKLQ
jgi:hypothetical protein